MASEVIDPFARAESGTLRAEEARLRSALAAVPANERALNEKIGHSHDAWVKMARAIERLGWGERGYAILRDWCAQSPAPSLLIQLHNEDHRHREKRRHCDVQNQTQPQRGGHNQKDGGEGSGA